MGRKTVLLTCWRKSLTLCQSPLPVLDQHFEPLRVSGHELVGLAEAELDRIVASVKGVVKGRLV